MKKTPLRSHTALTRKTRLKAKGRSRFPKRRNSAYLAWIQSMPCLLWNDKQRACQGAPFGRLFVEPAHVKTRGSGGYDVGNVVPLCPKHHDEQEGRTREFEAKYSIDLKAEAARLAAEWEDQSR